MGGRESLCFYRYDGFLCFYLLPFPFLFPLSVLKGSQPSLEGLETSLNPVWSPEVLKSFSCLPKNPSINYLVSFPLFSLSFSLSLSIVFLFCFIRFGSFGICVCSSSFQLFSTVRSFFLPPWDSNPGALWENTKSKFQKLFNQTAKRESVRPSPNTTYIPWYWIYLRIFTILHPGLCFSLLDPLQHWWNVGDLTVTSPTRLTTMERGTAVNQELQCSGDGELGQLKLKYWNEALKFSASLQLNFLVPAKNPLQATQLRMAQVINNMVGFRFIKIISQKPALFLVKHHGCCLERHSGRPSLWLYTPFQATCPHVRSVLGSCRQLSIRSAARSWSSLDKESSDHLHLRLAALRSLIYHTQLYTYMIIYMCIYIYIYINIYIKIECACVCVFLCLCLCSCRCLYVCARRRRFSHLVPTCSNIFQPSKSSMRWAWSAWASCDFTSGEAPKSSGLKSGVADGVARSPGEARAVALFFPEPWQLSIAGTNRWGFLLG